MRAGLETESTRAINFVIGSKHMIGETFNDAWTDHQVMIA